MTERLIIALLVAWLQLLASGAAAQVAPEVQPGQLDNGIRAQDVRQAETPAPPVSERQAVELARQQYPGNLLRISLVGQGTNLRYQIRMENAGKVFTLFVDANTGAVVEGQ